MLAATAVRIAVGVASPAEASGSITQPAWATVDQASTRTAIRWRIATRLPKVTVTAAITPMTGAQVPPRADRPSESSTTRAVAPAVFDTTARNAATGSGAPA